MPKALESVMTQLDPIEAPEGREAAHAYGARASVFAGVSTPLTWKELEDGATPQDFTMRTVPTRLNAVSDPVGPVTRLP